MNTKDIVDCAMGRIKSDIALLNGKVVNVYTKEIVEADIAICKERIVHVGKNIADLIGENTKVIDVEGSILCPGLVESHVHIESSMLTLSNFTEAIIPHGTCSYHNISIISIYVKYYRLSSISNRSILFYLTNRFC